MSKVTFNDLKEVGAVWECRVDHHVYINITVRVVDRDSITAVVIHSTSEELIGMVYTCGARDINGLYVSVALLT